MIPNFPAFEPVSEKNLKDIKAFIDKYPPDISDLSSGNLWGYRNTLNYHVAQLNGNLLIFSMTETSPFFLPPVGAGSGFFEILRTMLMYLREKRGGGVVTSVPEEMANSAAAFGIKIEAKRDDADYVYKVTDLAHMKGDKFQAKRNFANYFSKNYKYSYEPMTKECLQECLELQEKWCNMKKCIIFKSLEAENVAIYEMLNNFETLGLFGAVIRINGKLQAFSIAERLNPKTVVVHVQKANVEFRGIYQMLNKLFCSTTVKDYEFVNWEQDLGNLGLRKAKISYNPLRLAMKYDLHF